MLTCLCTHQHRYEIFEQARRISENIIYYLPLTTDARQLTDLAAKTKKKKCELEHHFVHGREVAVSVYYGDLCGSDN